MRLLNEPLKKATQRAVDDLRRDGGEGGVIAVDREGHGEFSMLNGVGWISIRNASGHASELWWYVSRSHTERWSGKNGYIC